MLSGGAQSDRERVAFVGPYAGICRALWISGWYLGVVRDRTDGALIAFVRRQAGLDHLNWLRDPADASRVIEALKKWLVREAGVVWPSGKADTVLGRQYAVYAAQRGLLGMPGLTPDELPTNSEALKLDIADLGLLIRKERKAAR